MEVLRGFSLDEKLAYFYCCYVREEQVDPDTDKEAVKVWEAIASSKSRRVERIGYLLQRLENVSTAKVRHLDATFKAKRELLLLAEGTLGGGRHRKSSARSGNTACQRDTARINNELLLECGVLYVFNQDLLRSLHAFTKVDLQHLAAEKMDEMFQDLQQSMVLMYLLIVFNTVKPNPALERHLFELGTQAPYFTLGVMLDCLSQMNVFPGFPTKRLLLLISEWLRAILGDVKALDNLKRLRKDRVERERSNSKTPRSKRDKVSDVDDSQRCKSFNTYHDSVALDPQDPYYLQKKKFAQIRQEIHNRYLHVPHYAQKISPSNEKELATLSVDYLDDEWESRCEVVYQLFLLRMREYGTLFGNLMTLCCGSAMNARDKKTFFSRRPSSLESDIAEYALPQRQNDMSLNDIPLGSGASEHDPFYWKWILREKNIVLDVVNLLILFLGKNFRASHAYKAEFYFQFYTDANMMGTMTKFMNKDIATYVQASREGSGPIEANSGFASMEAEADKFCVKIEDDMRDFSLQNTRTLTSLLRILQKLTKRKPTLIKNALCRGGSIVWLKRVVSLQIPLPRLYALKLVKSQARFLGHQWLRKYTCFNLLTEVYLHVRPELEDDWLHYEDEDSNKQGNNDTSERILFGEVQAYHHKHYLEQLRSTAPSKTGGATSLIWEANKELDETKFLVDGGKIARFFNELKLDPAGFCQQYEKWLDAERLVASSVHEKLPIAF